MTYLMTSSAVALKGRPFILTMPSPPKRRASAACISLRGTCSSQSNVTQLSTNLLYVRHCWQACVLRPCQINTTQKYNMQNCHCSCSSAWAMQATTEHMPSNLPPQQISAYAPFLPSPYVILPGLRNHNTASPLPQDGAHCVCFSGGVMWFCYVVCPLWSETRHFSTPELWMQSA